MVVQVDLSRRTSRAIPAWVTAARELGDQQARELTRDIEQLVREQLATNRGFEIKELADGMMLAFQSARRAVNCARAIQAAIAQRYRQSDGPDVALRIGMHTGEVKTEAGDLHGVTVNAANRERRRAEWYFRLGDHPRRSRRRRFRACRPR